MLFRIAHTLFCMALKVAARASGPARALGPTLQSSFAFASIHLVMPLSAGQPLGELYLKPVSLGGLCDGMITMPTASPV
jgi:hypothetical protein